jgi:RNA polymerase sigma-70 factor (ECF subfamily)
VSLGPLLLSIDFPEAGASEAGLEAGRVEAFVREQHAFVWRVLRRLGLSSADADDAAQRVFMIAVGRLRDIQRGSERAFLFRTARHVASKAHRSRSRRPEALELEEDGGAGDHPTADTLLDQRRARDLLDRILAELSEELRSVFVLFDIEGLTKSEVAEALGIPAGTVASRLSRARAEIEARVLRHQARARFRGAPP